MSFQPVLLANINIVLVLLLLLLLLLFYPWKIPRVC